jgi:hypothetical protein
MLPIGAVQGALQCWLGFPPSAMARAIEGPNFFAVRRCRWAVVQWFRTAALI